MSQAASPAGSVMYKPASNQTAYVTYSDSVQAPDTAPASSAGVIVANANQVLPPYRSNEVEIGYKVASRRMNFTTDVFRIRRPFADAVEVSTTVGTNCGGVVLTSGEICENYQIIGQQINFGAEAMLSGNVTRSLRVIGGIIALNPKLTHTFVLLPVGNPYVSATCTAPPGVNPSALICPSYVTNNQNLVGIPDTKSNILAQYQIPLLRRAFFTFDWQRV
ncbi:MAG: TonB-dependent receptor, partial [Acidobacteriaceae bacterium]